MTASTDDVLREAMLAHRAGRIAAAEVGYRRVLRKRPRDARALYFLGLLKFHHGEREAGIGYVSQSLEVNPSDARAWNALGGMLIAVERPLEAMRAYQRATEVAPEVAEGWYNLGICYRNAGSAEQAVQTLRTAIAREPDYFRAYEALAMLLYQTGQLEEAARLYSEWIRRDPSSATARYLSAATSGKEVPPRAPDDYIRELFDQAAAGFDAKLAQLAYRAPELVVEALAARLAGNVLPSVLDAGCGTGLCGPLLRPHCHRLIGVDLSPKMIERARARGCYDELAVADLSAFMRSQSGVFDAVISADTLVYFGELEEPLTAAREALRPAGWLVFTVEALDEPGASGHRLQFHGRYAHSETYLREALAAASFDLVDLMRETLRQEADQDVSGYVVMAQRR